MNIVTFTSACAQKIERQTEMVNHVPPMPESSTTASERYCRYRQRFLKRFPEGLPGRIPKIDSIRKENH